MYKILLVALALLFPMGAYATPVPWDGDFSNQILKPLTSFDGAEVKVNLLSATSTIIANNATTTDLAVTGELSFDSANDIGLKHITGAGDGIALFESESAGNGFSNLYSTGDFYIAANVGSDGGGSYFPAIQIVGTSTIGTAEPAWEIFTGNKGVSIRTGNLTVDREVQFPDLAGTLRIEDSNGNFPFGSVATSTAPVWIDTSASSTNLASGGSYNINDASVLNATTLGGGVTGSSLTSVGTIATGVWEATDVGVAHGGTGASNASDARDNLGLTIGTNVQAWDAGLDDIAGLASSTGNLIMGSSTEWAALTVGSDGQVLTASSTAAGGLAWETVSSGASTFTGLTDTPANYNSASSSFVRVNSTPDALEFVAGSSINISEFNNDSGYITDTLTEEEVEDFVGGMLTGNTETLITVTYEDGDGTIDFVVDNDLANYDNSTSGFLVDSNNLSDVASSTVARSNLGLGSLAIQNTINDDDWSGTDLAITNGGTGASNASDARDNLGLTIGSDVQAWDDDLDDLAGLTPTKGDVITTAGTNWTDFAVGSDGTVLMASSTATNGISWETVSGGASEDGGDVTTVCSSGCDKTTDGTADDVQIQEALDEGNNVVLGAETFDIQATIKVQDNDSLRGQGITTMLSASSSLNADIISASSTSANTFFVRVGDLKIDGDRTNNTSGHCIDATFAHSWIIENIHADNCADDAVHIEGDASNLSLNNQIIASRLEDPAGDGVEIGDFAPNNHIKDNIIDAPNSGFPVLLKNTETIVKGNHIHSCDTHCVTTEGAGDNNIITNNYIETAGTDFGAGGSGIFIHESATGNRLSNNVIFNHNEYGIDIEGDNTSVIGNKAFDRQSPKTQDYGLHASSSAASTTVVGNDFSGNLTGEINDNGSDTTLLANNNSSNSLVSNLDITGALDVTDTSTTRTNLGLAIGSDVQAWDTSLDTISGLATTTANILVGAGSDWSVFSAGGCSDGQYVGASSTATTGLDCFDDQDSGGATAWDNIGDPSGNGEIQFGSTVQRIHTASASNTVAVEDGVAFFEGGIHASSTNGIDFNPGSDQDVDLVTVGVTGTPTWSWDESEDTFDFNKAISKDGGVIFEDADASHSLSLGSGNSGLVFTAGTTGLHFTEGVLEINGNPGTSGTGGWYGIQLDVDRSGFSGTGEELLLKLAVDGDDKLTVSSSSAIVATSTSTFSLDGGTTAIDSSELNRLDGLASAILENDDIGTSVQAWDAFLDDIAALTDPNANSVLGWDDTAGAMEFLTASEVLSIVGGAANDFDGSGDLATDSVADNEIDYTAVTLSDFTIDAAAYDFGGVTSIEIPNGADPTVDAQGELAWDTTDNTLIGYDGTAERVIGHDIEQTTFTIYADNSWASEEVPIWIAPKDMAITIVQVHAAVMGTTPSLNYNIEERAKGSLASAGTDIYSADQAADATGEDETTFSNAGIAAGAHLVLTTDSSPETGTVDLITGIIYYRKDVE